MYTICKMLLEKRKVTRNGNSGHIRIHKDYIDEYVYIVDEEMLRLLRGINKDD